jgi:hypothetical protein
LFLERFKSHRLLLLELLKSDSFLLLELLKSDSFLLLELELTLCLSLLETCFGAVFFAPHAFNSLRLLNFEASPAFVFFLLQTLSVHTFLFINPQSTSVLLSVALGT